MNRLPQRKAARLLYGDYLHCKCLVSDIMSLLCGDWPQLEIGRSCPYVGQGIVGSTSFTCQGWDRHLGIEVEDCQATPTRSGPMNPIEVYGSPKWKE